MTSYKYNYNKKHTAYSRINRKNQTEAEKLLWFHIRNRQISGFKFRRQYPIDNFILDFYCVDKKIAIEIDGSQHQDRQAFDEKRSQALKRHGIQIIRFWNNDVLRDIQTILQVIDSRLLDAQPTSS